ncbi:MAG: hemolysin family protein [Planctomycetota bacterium]|jgi:CBS domain containing-hemolysin-like protein
MMLAWLVAALLLIPATWMAALTQAVRSISRSSLASRLAGTSREETVAWFVDQVEAAEVSLAFLRTLLRIAIVASVVVAFGQAPAAIAGGETPPADGVLLTPGSLVAAFLVSAALVWFSTVVLAAALARSAGEPLVAASLRWIRVLTALLTPFRPVVRITHESVRRLAGAERREGESEAEAELLRSIEEQQRGGGLDPQSASMLENIVWFNQTDVGEVMTPRTDIDGIEYTDDLSEIRALIDEHGHSRMPVFEENLDHILGILYVKDLVPYLGADPSGFRLRPLLREPKVVPETKPVNELLQDFQRSEVHMAIVVDEYGGTAGIVTIEDVLEEIVGEIQDEHDTDHEDLPKLETIEPGLVQVDGRYHLDDLNEELGLSLPEDEEYDTVAGFVLARLGRVPAAGEAIAVDGARLTVLEASSTAIERLRVEHGDRIAAEATAMPEQSAGAAGLEATTEAAAGETGAADAAGEDATRVG